MSFLTNLFGEGDSSNKVTEYLNNGAVIIDVRSPGEFSMGHQEGSQNIPLQEIESQIETIKAMNKQVVVCCASGARSGQAKMILESEGIEVENAGGWHALKALVN